VMSGLTVCLMTAPRVCCAQMTVYEKGAEVVRLYSTLLGKEGFRKGGCVELVHCFVYLCVCMCACVQMTVYMKGAEIVRLNNSLLGKEGFRKGGFLW